MGCGPQLTTLAFLVVATPAFRPHAGELEPGRESQPQGQVQRQRHDDLVRCDFVDHTRSTLGTLAGLQLHGVRADMAVVSPGASAAVTPGHRPHPRIPQHRRTLALQELQSIASC